MSSPNYEFLYFLAM